MPVVFLFHPDKVCFYFSTNVVFYFFPNKGYFDSILEIDCFCFLSRQRLFYSFSQTAADIYFLNFYPYGCFYFSPKNDFYSSSLFFNSRNLQFFNITVENGGFLFYSDIGWFFIPHQTVCFLFLHSRQFSVSNQTKAVFFYISPDNVYIFIHAQKITAFFFSSNNSLHFTQ